MLTLNSCKKKIKKKKKKKKIEVKMNRFVK